MSDSWEARMAARAAARARAMPDLQQAEWDRRDAEHDRLMRQQIREAMGRMTLGEAVELLRMPPFGCACSGGIYCCFNTFAQARRLVRAAHIAVKLIADLHTDYPAKLTPDRFLALKK